MARGKTKQPPKTDVASAGIAQREPRTSSVAGWNPERLRSTEIQCQSGNFSLVSELCETMMGDERVAKCLRRLHSATTLPLTFKLPGLDDEKSLKDPICQALAVDFWKILPEQTLYSIVEWIVLAHCALIHIDKWDLDKETGRVLPVLKVWALRNLRNDAQLGWVARVATSTSDYFGTEIQITPGDGTWAIFTIGGDYRSVYRAPWRGISRWWLLGKLYAPIDWAASSERHGQGREYITNTLTGSSLEDDVGESMTQQQAEQLAAKVATMGRNAVAVMPRGWKPDLVTDGANTYATFKAQKEAADSAIDIGLLGTNLTTEVSGKGSYAAAEIHASIDAGVMRGLLELLATGIREQILVHWALYNFGSGAVAPYPVWDTTPPEDKKATSEARKADADALLTYRKAGAQLNQKAWFEGRVELTKDAGEEFAAPEQSGNADAGPAPTPAWFEGRVELTKDAGEEFAAPEQSGNVDAGPAPTPGKTAGIRAQAKSEKTDALFRGLNYADRLEESTRRHAAKELAPTLASVLAAVERAEDYEQAKQAILEAYQDRAPVSQLCRLTESMMLMAQLAGAEAVRQEVLEDTDDEA